MILTVAESSIFRTMVDAMYGNYFIPIEYTDVNVYSTLYLIRRFVRRCARYMPIMDYMFGRPVVTFRDIIEPIGTMYTISRICEDWEGSTIEDTWANYVPDLRWVRSDSPDNFDILHDLEAKGFPHLWLLSYVRIVNNMFNAPINRNVPDRFLHRLNTPHETLILSKSRLYPFRIHENTIHVFGEWCRTHTLEAQLESLVALSSIDGGTPIEVQLQIVVLSRLGTNEFEYAMRIFVSNDIVPAFDSLFLYGIELISNDCDIFEHLMAHLDNEYIRIWIIHNWIKVGNFDTIAKYIITHTWKDRIALDILYRENMFLPVITNAISISLRGIVDEPSPIDKYVIDNFPPSLSSRVYIDEYRNLL
jgi:hypothetical protein